MSSIKLTADSGGGTVEFKAPATTASNAAKVITLSQNPGMIIQVVQSVKTDTFSHNAVSRADITDLSVAITPSSSSNKILVTYSLFVSGPNGSNTSYIHLMRGSTDIYEGDTASIRTRASGVMWTTNDSNGHMYPQLISGQFLDSPNTTSATTYKLQLEGVNSGATYYVGRSSDDSDSAGTARTPCQITAMEVAG